MSETEHAIRRALPGDEAALAALAHSLWPHHTAEELMPDFADILSDADAACFLAGKPGQEIGFAHCQLRHDYVEGTSTSPVGYLEGIYVTDAHRGQGIASLLLDACQSWARARGCREFASDCELHNTDSLRFHLSVGFEEANRIICFRKDI